MKKIIPAWLLIIVLCFIFGCTAEEEVERSKPAEKPERGYAYQLESFEDYKPSVWCFKKGARGQSESESDIVKEGRRAARVSWDFNEVADDPGYVNYFFHREVVGDPYKLSVWVYNDNLDTAPNELKLWMEDISGEIFIVGVPVDWVEWKRLEFQFEDVGSPWKSGDGNGQQDLPMSLFGFAVGKGKSDQGFLIIDDVQVYTEATPRESLLAYVKTTRKDNLFWQDVPEIIVGAGNYSGTDLSDIQFDLKIYDTYSDILLATETLTVASVPGEGTGESSLTIDLPYGVHRVQWKMYDRQGTLREDEMEFGRTMMPALKDASDQTVAYMRETWPYGGVFWQMPPETGSDLGARWIRNWVDWKYLEPEKGVYDTERVKKRLQDFLSEDIESIWLLGTSDKTGYYRQSQPGFARAYGNAWNAIAKATSGDLNWYELGNEDNGPQKYLYTEAARHGAAAIRKNNPGGLIANSGTAFVDLVWARMQADRGLFDRLDALCVHPYTTSASPEQWKVFDDARKCWSFIDETGGMKYVWTTEFGWHHDFDQKKRSEWIPRHFQMGVAGGYDKHGLFSWAGHFGIYSGSKPTLSAISVHAMMKILEGYRFGGVLERKEEQWVVLWEKFGKPVIVCWSPVGEKTLRIPVGEQPARVLDMFGNPMPVDIREGWLYLNLTSGPQYVLDAPWDPTMYAWGSTLESFHKRYASHLENSTLSEDPVLQQIASLDKRATAEELWEALVHVNDADADINEITAIEANMLRLLLQQVKMGMGQDLIDDVTGEIEGFDEIAQTAFAAAAAEDIEIPALRWVITEYNRYELERQVAISENADEAVTRLQTAQAVLAKFGKNLIIDHEKFYRFNAVWPYLFNISENGDLEEHLSFVPGTETSVKMRVNSYANNDYTGTVSVQLPQGWSLSPESREVEIPTGSEVVVDFIIRCAPDAAETPTLYATLAIEGKPEVRIPFNDTEIVSPVKVELRPVDDEPDRASLTVALLNEDSKEHSGTLSFYFENIDEISSPIPKLSPGESGMIEIDLKERLQPAKFNEYPVRAELVLDDGRKVSEQHRLNFQAVVHASEAPVIDGDLSDWTDALPFHLDSEEFSNGTFSGRWTPEDLSGTFYFKWDEENVYIAVDVSDQTFSQDYELASIWMQDSVQIAFAPGTQSKGSEFGLAMTPSGEQVYQWEPAPGEVADASLVVDISQGRAVYEASIPWSAMEGFDNVQQLQTIRISFLINDDDVVVGRRFLESPGGGISHSKEIENFLQMTMLK